MKERTGRLGEWETGRKIVAVYRLRPFSPSPILPVLFCSAFIFALNA